MRAWLLELIVLVCTLQRSVDMFMSGGMMNYRPDHWDFDIVQCFDNILPCLRFVGRRYGIFKVKKYIIGSTIGRFFEHPEI